MGYLILAMNSIYFNMIYTTVTNWLIYNFGICSLGIKNI